MAFSPWQILSPVQWAKWTWSAVRGGGAGEDEAGGPEGDPEEEEDSQAETKSLSFRQVHSIPRRGAPVLALWLLHPRLVPARRPRASVCPCARPCVRVRVCSRPPALTRVGVGAAGSPPR